LEIISKNYMLEFMLDAIELVVFEHFDAWDPILDLNEYLWMWNKKLLDILVKFATRNLCDAELTQTCCHLRSLITHFILGDLIIIVLIFLLNDYKMFFWCNVIVIIHWTSWHDLYLNKKINLGIIFDHGLNAT
jgi:hypothetical protein